MCILISVQLLSETFLYLRTNDRDMIKNVYRSLCKVPVILVLLNKAWIFSTDFQKLLQYQISWKSVHWEPSCSIWAGWRAGGRTDGRTGRLDVDILNFANPLKTVCSPHQIRIWNSSFPSSFVVKSYLLFYSILHSTCSYISSTLS